MATHVPRGVSLGHTPEGPPAPPTPGPPYAWFGVPRSASPHVGLDVSNATGNDPGPVFVILTREYGSSASKSAPAGMGLPSSSTEKSIIAAVDPAGHITSGVGFGV